VTGDLVNTLHHFAKQALPVKFAHARTETHCNILWTLQHAATQGRLDMTGDLVNTLDHSATQALHSKSADACATTHCNTPHTATRCNTGRA